MHMHIVVHVHVHVVRDGGKLICAVARSDAGRVSFLRFKPAALRESERFLHHGPKSPTGNGGCPLLESC